MRHLLFVFGNQATNIETSFTCHLIFTLGLRFLMLSWDPSLSESHCIASKPFKIAGSEPVQVKMIQDINYLFTFVFCNFISWLSAAKKPPSPKIVNSLSPWNHNSTRQAYAHQSVMVVSSTPLLLSVNSAFVDTWSFWSWFRRTFVELAYS